MFNHPSIGGIKNKGKMEEKWGDKRIKIIFLDIDGVLATSEYLKDGLWALNPEKQKLLGKLLINTNKKTIRRK